MAQEKHDIRNHVGGEWIGSATGKTTANINPADTDEVLGQVPLQDRETARRAIAAAKAAFPAWRATPGPKRGAILFKALSTLGKRAEELARAMTLEEGKTLAEARGEVQKSFNVLEFIAGEGRRLRGETLPSEMPSTVAYTVREPLGVVSIITPWNFPVAIPVWKIAPALVCGNTVVFKPATLTPWCGEILVEAFLEAGLPAGVLNFVTGSGGVVGEELISHPDVRAVSFTGSNDVGMHLYEVAARTGKKVQCEMGGKNPVVVLADADLELAADAICQGAFGSTGQRCTATSRVVVEAPVLEKLTALVLERAKRVVVGNPLREGVTMGPSVDQSQMETVLQGIEIAKREGAKVLLGGARLQTEETRRGFFIAPTVLAGITPTMTVAQEELFGPVLAILPVKDAEQAIEVANGVRYGLSSSIFTRDVNRVFSFLDRIETGITHVNSPTVGGEAHLPFGGTKATGIGAREQGSTAIEFYSELKTVYIDFTGQVRQTKIY
jgi:aldehyde dehydrogenase (NAD+)